MTPTTLNPPITQHPVTDALLNAFHESSTVGVHMGRGYEGDQVAYVNDAFLSMLGYTREDFEAGKINWKEMTPPESHEADVAAVNNLNTLGSTPAFAKQYVDTNGNRIDVWLQPVLVPGTKEDWLCYMVQR